MGAGYLFTPNKLFFALGWTLLYCMGNTRPECFQGVSNFQTKNKGSQIVRRKFNGCLKSISKFDQFFFSKFPIFWKIQIQTSQKS